MEWLIAGFPVSDGRPYWSRTGDHAMQDMIPHLEGMINAVQTQPAPGAALPWLHAFGSALVAGGYTTYPMLAA
jgi:hypothetical protein